MYIRLNELVEKENRQHVQTRPGNGSPDQGSQPHRVSNSGLAGLGHGSVCQTTQVLITSNLQCICASNRSVTGSDRVTRSKTAGLGQNFKLSS